METPHGHRHAERTQADPDYGMESRHGALPFTPACWLADPSNQVSWFRLNTPKRSRCQKGHRQGPGYTIESLNVLGYRQFYTKRSWIDTLLSLPSCQKSLASVNDNVEYPFVQKIPGVSWLQVVPSETSAPGANREEIGRSFETLDLGSVHCPGCYLTCKLHMRCTMLLLLLSNATAATLRSL